MPKPPSRTTKPKARRRPLRASKTDRVVADPKADKGRETTREKRERLLATIDRLESRLIEVPDEWLEEKTPYEGGGSDLRPRPCETYRELERSWRKALKWRRDLADVLITMLAVAASTAQQGDQLFLMVIGDPGSGKTRLCDAMIVNKLYTYPLEHLTGFFSGFKGDGDEDYSVITRANYKTMITPEGDTMISNPKFPEIMAQQRRIFDGTSGASYKNLKEDRRYTGLRTPWIMAGTYTLLETDQSRLGDRFLKVIMGSPSDEDARDIVERVRQTQWDAAAETAEGESQIGEKLKEAYEKTGGYISWLRENTDLIAEIKADEKYLRGLDELGYFVAYMRARPPKTEEGEASVEQPTRITGQLSKMLRFICYVQNLKEVNESAYRRTRKVALDTSRGITLDLVKAVYEAPQEYVSKKYLELTVDRSETSVDNMLRFLRKIGVMKLNTDAAGRRGKRVRSLWGLTPLADRLFRAGYLGEVEEREETA